MQKLFALDFNINFFVVNNGRVAMIFGHRLVGASVFLEKANVTAFTSINLLAVFVTGADAFLATGGENHNASQNEGANSNTFFIMI